MTKLQRSQIFPDYPSESGVDLLFIDLVNIPPMSELEFLTQNYDIHNEEGIIKVQQNYFVLQHQICAFHHCDPSTLRTYFYKAKPGLNDFLVLSSHDSFFTVKLSSRNCIPGSITLSEGKYTIPHQMTAYPVLAYFNWPGRRLVTRKIMNWAIMTEPQIRTALAPLRNIAAYTDIDKIEKMHQLVLAEVDVMFQQQTKYLRCREVDAVTREQMLLLARNAIPATDKTKKRVATIHTNF